MALQFQMNTMGRRSLSFFCTECENHPPTLKIETVQEVDNDKKGLRFESEQGAEMTIRCPRGHEQKVTFEPNCDVSI